MVTNSKSFIKSSLKKVGKIDLDKVEDIIIAVISQVNIVTHVSDWVIDSGANKHICANKNNFVSYTQVNKGEELVYLGNSKTTQVLGKGKVLLKLTFGKTLVLTEVLHVPNIRANLVSVSLLGKAGVKVLFESKKVVLTKNNIFVGKGCCNRGLFVLNVINENTSTAAYLIDSFDLWHARLGHVKLSYIKKMHSQALLLMSIFQVLISVKFVQKLNNLKNLMLLFLEKPICWI